MNVFTDNSQFYPTPTHTIKKMLEKLKRKPKTMLEPSAGKGDIIKFIEKANEEWRYGDKDNRLRSCLSINNIHCMEQDPNLINVLRSDKRLVVDTDFLSYSGADKYDAIVMNPPFVDGDKHLIKAMDIMYNGEIVCLLNAETIRNPYSVSRQYLIERLESAGAEIEFLEGEFSDAERKTDVDVALIYINIENDITSILLDGANDEAKNHTVNENDVYGSEVAERGSVENLVRQFNRTITAGIDTIMGFYRNHTILSQYLSLNIAETSTYKANNMTEKVSIEVNEFIKRVRYDYWMSTLNLKQVQDRMTEKKRDEFTDELSQQAIMDFTANNVRTFIMNLMNSYEDIVKEAAVDLFDSLTVEHAWSEGKNKNRLHWDSWKTNDVFKIGPKVILPFYESAFVDSYTKKWRTWIDHSTARKIDDIDKVMDYFSAETETVKISDAITSNLQNGTTRGFESTHFSITVYKKGTLHLQFKNDKTLAAFNRMASLGKGWLPSSYGKKGFDDMSQEDQNIVKAFEGEKSYSKFFKGGSQIMASGKSFLQIEE